MDQVTDQTVNLKSWTVETPLAPPVHMLVIQREDSPATRITVGHFPFVIGRARPSGLVLNDRAISRSHCRLDHDGDRLLLTDLNSTNGTYLNGVRLSAPSLLPDGALIRIGAHMLRYLRRAPEQVEEEAALERELKEATEYVAAILPAPLTTGAVRTEWFFQPSTQLSGDAFGYQWLDDRWFSVFMLDVAGHGTAAALHAVSVANSIRHKLLPEADFRNPASVLQSLNRVFSMEHHDERFFTIWYGAYDRETRTLHYAGGGHHPAYVVLPPGLIPAGMPGADPAEPTVATLPGCVAVPTPLSTRNPAIGIALDGPVKTGTATIPPGSTLHLFSDGAFEVATRTGQPLGLPEFVALLPTAGSPGGSRWLYDTVRARAGQPEDDFSLLVLRFA